MKIGLTLGSDYTPFQEVIKLAKYADSTGYTQISVPEIWAHDQITTLAVIANETERIKISTGIMNMYSRTPGLAGMTAASLDEMSNGRFILGLGLSGPIVVNNWHGREFKSPLKHTEDFVKIVRSILNFERVNFKSKTLGTLKNFRLGFKPTCNNIPIHIASIGPKNTELVARIADGWVPTILPSHVLGKLVKTIDEKRAKLNLSNKFDISPFTLTLLGDDKNTEKLLRAHLGYYLGGMGKFYNTMLAKSGFPTEAATIMEKYQKGDVLGAYAAIPEEALEMMTVSGSKEELAEKMHKLSLNGRVTPLVCCPFNSPTGQILETLKVLAPL